jgi:hypothetical protein
MNGLGPEIDPQAISGTVANNGPDDTFITAITVSIASVSGASGSASGACDSSDYVLLVARMEVEQSLAGGHSTTFGGASIGFSNKLTNQDACKGATLLLHYELT